MICTPERAVAARASTPYTVTIRRPGPCAVSPGTALIRRTPGAAGTAGRHWSEQQRRVPPSSNGSARRRPRLPRTAARPARSPGSPRRSRRRRAVRDRPVILRQLLAGAVIEALIVVAVVVAVLTASGSPPADVVTFWGYLVTALVVLPFAAAWAFAERTRWSSVVLVVAALTSAFLQYRLLQVFAG